MDIKFTPKPSSKQCGQYLSLWDLDILRCMHSPSYVCLSICPILYVLTIHLDIYLNS